MSPIIDTNEIALDIANEMSAECPFTADEIENFTYGDANFIAYLEWSGAQGGHTALQNLHDFAMQQFVEKYGRDTGMRIGETIIMAISSESTKEEALAGVYLTIRTFINFRRRLVEEQGMPLSRQYQVMTAMCDTVYDRYPWVFFQMQYYFNLYPSVYIMMESFNSESETEIP